MPPTAAVPMKKKIKPLHAVLGCAGLGVLGVILAGFLGLQALFFVTGKPYFDTPSDRAKLREIRDPLLVVPLALEAHHRLHGDYPKNIAGLDPSVPRLPEVQVAFRNTSLVYQTDGPAEYTLYMKLNWDGGLWFSSTSRDWVYDAGLGDPSWTIDR
jgi:hypothetical protein